MKINYKIKSIIEFLITVFIIVFISMVFSLKIFQFLLLVLVIYFLGFIIYYLKKFYYKLIKKSPIPEPEHSSYTIICKCPVSKRKYLKLLAIYMGLLLILYFLFYIIEVHYFLPKPEYLEIDGRLIELPAKRLPYHYSIIGMSIFLLFTEWFKKDDYILQFNENKLFISNALFNCEIDSQNINNIVRINDVKFKLDFNDDKSCIIKVPDTDFIPKLDIEKRKEKVDEIITKLKNINTTPAGSS